MSRVNIFEELNLSESHPGGVEVENEGDCVTSHTWQQSFTENAENTDSWLADQNSGFVTLKHTEPSAVIDLTGRRKGVNEY